jgi:hypothetical protein
MRPANLSPSGSRPSRGPGITDDHALRIREAIEILEADPQGAATWLERAKQSLVTIGLLSSATDAAPHHDDVLVIWEYLGRTLDLDTVSAIAGSGSEA